MCTSLLEKVTAGTYLHAVIAEPTSSLARDGEATQLRVRAMSRIVALWNESGASHSREIELAQGAEAILLTLTMDQTEEKTADERKELDATSILRLNDVIQIYPKPRQ